MQHLKGFVTNGIMMDYGQGTSKITFGANNAYCILNDINSHNDDNVYCVNTSSNVLIPRDLFVNQSLQGASLLGEEENNTLGALRFG